MRLTLRTLLSWKDGMLEAEEARDLAAKVKASDGARQIVAKIADAVGRPTLTASPPDAVGFATAANTTAEYLDNVLPADQLERYERLCYASDAQLAETAACHEMLATWSREPRIPLDPAARSRLLAAIRSRATAAAPASDPVPAPMEPVRRPAAAPSRPVRAPLSAWLLVAAAALLLLALGGVLAWSLASGGGKSGGDANVAGLDTPPRGPAPAGETAAPSGREPQAGGPPLVAEPMPSAEPPEAGAMPAGAGSRSDEASPTAVTVPAPAPVASVPAAPPVPPVPAPPPADTETDSARDAATSPARPAPVMAVEPRVPLGDATAIAAPAARAAAADGPPWGVEPAPQAPADPAAGAAARVVGSAVLLHRPRGGAADSWVAGAADTPLPLPVDLVAPPFGQPSFAVDDVRIALEPGTRAALSRDADGTPRLTVAFGAATAVGGGRLGVTAGDFAGLITAGLDAPVGVEVSLGREPGAAAEAAARTARVLPSAGAIEWRNATAAGGGAATAVPVGMALVWRSTAPDTSALEPVAALPAWLAGRRPAGSVDALAAQALESRLAAGSAAVPALREMAADRRVEGRVAAAATLALVGDFVEAARLLVAEGNAALPEAMWTRLEAAVVAPALARGPLAAEALERAFADHGPPGAAGTIVRFARGFSDEKLASGAAAELVAALESPHLVVRRYAIRNLVEITGVDAVDRLRYRADRPAEALREGAAWWRARLDQGRIVRGAAAGTRQ